MRCTFSSVLAAAALVACVGSSEPLSERGFDGPGVAVGVAALTLGPVADSVWDLRVENAAGDTVFAQRITASRYGAGGSATYVGPCDATSNPNRVFVELIGIYDAEVTDPEAPGAGLAVQNPGELMQEVACLANGDVLVEFNVTVMRPADQGFFDIAVNFGDLFCSAKLDCEGASLLHDAEGERGPTFIVGLACSGGGGDIDTRLFRDSLRISGCASGHSVEIFPHVGRGNLCAAGQTDTCGAWVVTDPGELLFQVAVYEGEESLTLGDVSLNKRFWNVALGVDASKDWTGCVLEGVATAADGELPGGGGLIPTDTVYPIIAWRVAIEEACPGSYPVVFAAPGAETVSCGAEVPCATGYYCTDGACTPGTQVSYVGSADYASGYYLPFSRPGLFEVAALTPTSLTLAVNAAPTMTHVFVGDASGTGAFAWFEAGAAGQPLTPLAICTAEGAPPAELPAGDYVVTGWRLNTPPGACEPPNSPVPPVAVEFATISPAGPATCPCWDAAVVAAEYQAVIDSGEYQMAHLQFVDGDNWVAVAAYDPFVGETAGYNTTSERYCGRGEMGAEPDHHHISEAALDACVADIAMFTANRCGGACALGEVCDYSDGIVSCFTPG